MERTASRDAGDVGLDRLRGREHGCPAGPRRRAAKRRTHDPSKGLAPRRGPDS